MKAFVKIEFRDATSTSVPLVCGNSGYNYGVAVRDKKTGRLTKRVTLEEWQSVATGARCAMKDDFAVGVRKLHCPLSIDFCSEEEGERSQESGVRSQKAGASQQAPLDIPDTPEIPAPLPAPPPEPPPEAKPPAKPRGRPKKAKE